MQKTLKILVVRFSSIGDIVLTTPVIRCLKKQLKAEVHYLTKSEYSPLLLNNPYLDKLHFLNHNVRETVCYLRKENFDYVIDLHKNIRSRLIIFRLGVKHKQYYKSNFKKLLLIKFGINILDELHVVERYMRAINFLEVKNDNKGIDYFLPSKISLDFDIEKRFVSWNIGASYTNKKLPLNIILEVCQNVVEPIVLLGGEEEVELARKIMKQSNKDNIYSFCGELSLSESAYLIKHSSLLLTNDSGMMHIGSAFQRPIISFWGCTKPILGFSPYQNQNDSILILANNSIRPCSRHGAKCRFIKRTCIRNISSEEITQAYKTLILRK